MKIVSLQSENIKRLVAVEIKPDGNLVEITGKNGQGKSSVLDSIWWALAGAGNIQEQPIRKGETTAKIRLDLGDIVVTRTFTAREDGEYTTAITVENAEGARYQSPQFMLDKLLGSLTFDPLEFARMPPKAQFDTLAAFVPGVDFSAIEKEQREDFGSRTTVNRVAKEARAAAAQIKVEAEGPTEQVDVSELVKQLSYAASRNAEIERRKANRANVAETIRSKREAAEKLLAEAKELEERLLTAEHLPEPTDVARLQDQIEAANVANAQIADRIRKRKLLADAEAAEAKSKELTEAMERRAAEKEKAIAEAKLPVSGVGFGEGYITLNGVPFDQASSAEQLRASVAIAMALNPKLRVLRVRDGALLDEDSLRLVAEAAKESDYQVWVETVSNGERKTAFVIEDGRVKNEAATS